MPRGTAAFYAAVLAGGATASTWLGIQGYDKASALVLIITFVVFTYGPITNRRLMSKAHPDHRTPTPEERERLRKELPP